MSSITPFLWFDKDALEAAEFYVSLFPNSAITRVTRYPEGSPGTPGEVMVVGFVLDGMQIQALNGGPQFGFTEAISFSVDAPTQERIDELWDALTADGGEESQCGWLKDRFGLSWQITPPRLVELMSDPATAPKAMEAMLKMRKIILADIEAAVAA